MRDGLRGAPRRVHQRALYKQMADALQTDGHVAAGYKTISIDDCWESGTPGVLRRP